MLSLRRPTNLLTGPTRCSTVVTAPTSRSSSAIRAQLLCNLAKSDPEQRILAHFYALRGVTRDVRFVTARHCLQAIWKDGPAGTQQRQRVVDQLTERSQDCGGEKNHTLIHYIIIAGLRKLSDVMQDEHIREVALGLIATELDSKYRQKYGALWQLGASSLTRNADERASH